MTSQRVGDARDDINDRRQRAKTHATTSQLTPLLTRSPGGYVTGCVTSALLLQRSKAQRAATELDDTAGNANVSISSHLESQPATPSHRLALIDRQPLRQRRAGRQQPSAEVG